MTLTTTILNHLQQTKQSIEKSLISFTDKTEQVSDDWKQTATQGTQTVIDTFTNSLEHLPQVGIQTVLTSSVTDWFEQHPVFLTIIKSLNWSINHPIVSLIILLFSLAIFWSLIKAITRLIESTSLSILQIPLKLFQILVKYSWRILKNLGNSPTQKNQDIKTSDNTLNISQLQGNTTYHIMSCNKQQRLTNITLRLEEIQREQQELLQEAAAILDLEKINSSVN
ncbi:MAG: hypothetical protein AAF915_03130 [Cyanobacteria bacterium P01_D01_bin.50]